jgi:CO dehydrogenase maturation factor
VQTAQTVRRLAADIGVKDIVAVGNRVRSEADEEFLRSALDGIDLIGALPDSDEIRDADRDGRSAYGVDPEYTRALREIAAALLGRTEDK